MSAFCVFGMTKTAAKALAQQQFDRAWPGLSEEERKRFPTDEDVAREVEARAALLLVDGASRQVSPPFDAPQFAQDWINLAIKTDGARRCRVMCRGYKRDENGNPRISKATGKPMEGWVTYVGSP